MSKLYLITSLLAVSFYSYAQYRGMSVYTGGGSSAQQLARSSGGTGSSGWSRSSSLSHK